MKHVLQGAAGIRLQAMMRTGRFATGVPVPDLQRREAAPVSNDISDKDADGALAARRSKTPLYMVVALAVLILVVFGILHVFGLNIGVQI